MGTRDEHGSDGPPVAVVRSLEVADLVFDEGPALACAYAVVDGDDPFTAAFLDDLHDCDDVTAWDWWARRTDRAARLGLHIRHACGRGAELRLELPLPSAHRALVALAERQVLVVADGPWGLHPALVAPRVMAVGVDGAQLRRALAEVGRGLRALALVN